MSKEVHISWDVETSSTNPSKACCLSIGAHVIGSTEVSIPSKLAGHTWRSANSISIKVWGYLDPEIPWSSTTKSWWADPERDQAREFLTPLSFRTIRELALYNIQSWLHKWIDNDIEPIFCAWPVQFDYNVIWNCFEQHGIDPAPLLNYRTVDLASWIMGRRNLLNRNGNHAEFQTEYNDGLIEHVALHDAIAQARCVERLGYGIAADSNSTNDI